jgi:hypothetical protein
MQAPVAGEGAPARSGTHQQVVFVDVAAEDKDVVFAQQFQQALTLCLVVFVGE